MNGKNKKSKLSFIVILCIFVVLIGIILGIVYLTKRTEDKTKCDDAKIVVSDFLESYKSKQPNTIKYLEYSFSDSGMNFEGFQGLLAEKINYSIKDVVEEENQIVVISEITNVDLKKVFDDVLSQLSENNTQAEILEALKQKLTKSNCSRKTFECEIILVENNGYKIVMTDTLSNALLGGYNEYLAELTTVKEVAGDE